MWLVLLYDVTDDYLSRRGEFREEHLALCRAARERGELAMAGAFTDPADATMLIWSTDDRAVVERFVAADPYGRAGLVRGYRIRAWTVAVGGPAEVTGSQVRA
jgi:uncharacterized protein YciI